MILRGIVASSLVGKSDPGYNGGDRARPKRLKQNSSIGHADIGEELEMIFGSKNFHITYVTLILLVGCSGSSGSRCIRRMSGSDRCDCAANLGLRRNSGIVEEV